MRGAHAALYPVLNRNSNIPLANRLAIYKIYFKPIIMYVVPAWCHWIGPNTQKKVEVFQNVMLYTITGTLYFTSNKNILKFTVLLPLQDDALRLTNILAHILQTSKFPHLSIHYLHNRPVLVKTTLPTERQGCKPGALDRPLAVHPEQSAIF